MACTRGHGQKRWNRKTERWEDFPPSYVWRPFREVPLVLRLDRFEQRRAAGIFWWRDEEGKRYPMFAKEFNRLVGEGLLAASIDGVWSAEKRGANYGVRLVANGGRMRYVSLFSGIEAASVAAGPLGWEPVCFCEVDEFPSAVLAHRYPEVPNLGDITKVDWKEVLREHGPVDAVVGGSPCQSFSIAGKREGLEGASGLMFEYIRAVSEIMPRYWVWENVPGALSSSGGGRLRMLPPGDGWHQGCWW